MAKESLSSIIENYRSEEVVTAVKHIVKVKTLNELKKVIIEQPELAAQIENIFSKDFIECETSFFRDPYVFKFYEKVVIPYLKDRNEKTKILVLPSSTGEEAYSVVIANLMQDFKNFAVDGADISESCISRANIGQYDLLENVNLYDQWNSKQLYRFFDPNGCATNKVKDSVKEYTHFFVHDILSSTLEGKYDVVFCLHLLEHLSKKGRDTALKNMLSSMNNDSYLIMHTLDPSAGGIAGQMFQYEQKEYFDNLHIKGLNRIETPWLEVVFKYKK